MQAPESEHMTCMAAYLVFNFLQGLCTLRGACTLDCEMADQQKLAYICPCYLIGCCRGKMYEKCMSTILFATE